MVDIQSATPENRQGKKEKKEEERRRRHHRAVIIIYAYSKIANCEVG